MEKATTPSTMTMQSTPSMSQASASTTIATTECSQIRVIERSEYKQAAQCLAHAFKDDEVATYPLDTDDHGKSWNAHKRWKLHVHILECLVLAHIMRGQVTTNGPDYDCVALWMPPSREFDDFCAQLRSGLLTLRFKLTKEGNTRFYKEFLPLLHDIKHEVLGEDDARAWYLVYIGTKPESRGKGYARALVEWTTAQADAQSRPCYLESSNVLNNALYNRLGFAAVGRKAVLKRGRKPVEMEIMVRKPLAGKGVVVLEEEKVMEGKVEL